MPSGFFVWETIRCRLDAFLWYAMHISKEGFSLPKILIVEDELPIADLIRLTLKSAGYLCDHAPDGDQAADLAAAGNYDLALVDVMLPRTDGFTLLEYFQSLELPVIFVTARSAVADRVKGLKLGAEDYIVKPFDVAELLARVETVLRRFHKTEETLSLAGVRVDPRARKVWRGEEEVSLTPKEYDLLLLFLHNPNAALYRDTIYERVWGGELAYGSKTVDLHVQRLRKKVGWEKALQAVCSATSFLRNWDSILEKKRANLRSISEPARLRQPPPQKHGSGTRKRAGSKHTGGATNSRPSRAFCPLVG